MRRATTCRESGCDTLHRRAILKCGCPRAMPPHRPAPTPSEALAEPKHAAQPAPCAARLMHSGKEAARAEA
eukprot:scaffold479_cov376-Prasinococcus_capsulatus_cf.AAC.12